MSTVKGRSLKTLLIDLKNWFALKADTVFSVNGNKPKANGDVFIKEVDLATNLSSDRTQTSDDEFIIRTSGGEAPIQDGDAFALRFLGNMIHTGYVAESLTLTVNAVTRPVPSAITAVLDTSVFEAYVEIAGTYTLIYDGSDWDNDPTLYGITVSNTPVSGDTIEVVWDGVDTPDMTVNAVPRVAPPAITATIDRDTFVGYVSASGTTVLEYDGSAWDYDPADYGVTITNAPLEGDKITIVYVKEDRGLITPATPTSFVSTGWNLYNYDAGYARVCKYRESFRVGGTYTSLSFSPTLSGVQTPIEVVDSMFNIPSDGYVFVTGGNETDTYIINAWTDWTEGVPSGITYEKYSQSVVDISTIMDTYFTNGLYRIGDVYDEINLNASLAISRIGRLAYDPTNQDVIDIIESGRAYVIDTSYIYFVKESANSYSIDIDGYYVVSDHGNELFLGTSVPVYLETLYGNNLKNKLETDVLTISEQTLTSAQQAQVRTNIGAASATQNRHNIGNSYTEVRNNANNATFIISPTTPSASSPGIWVDYNPTADTITYYKNVGKGWVSAGSSPIDVSGQLATKQAKFVRKTAGVTFTNGIGYLNESYTTLVVGASIQAYPCMVGFYNNKWFLCATDISNGSIIANSGTFTVQYWTI